MAEKNGQLQTALDKANRVIAEISRVSSHASAEQDGIQLVAHLASLQEKLARVRGLIRECLSLAEKPDGYREEKERVPKELEIIGHRGCGYEPENTLRAFREVLRQNVDRIEFDVWRCSSGELAVIHDETLDRTTNGTGRVTSFTLTELQSLDAGMGEKIPTLNQVLDAIAGKTKICIELKEEGLTEDVATLIDHYVQTKGWAYGDFMVSSFNHRELEKLRQRFPQIKIGAILYGIPLQVSDLKQRFGADSLHVSTEFISQELIDEAHRNGMMVFVYTVNNANDFRRVLPMGIDGICSDYPDRFSH